MIDAKRKASKQTTDAARSAQMALICGKNTKPELIVESIVRDLNLKFHRHVTDLPGRPDLVFMRRRRVIFVHGCFWHQHKSKKCWRSRIPKTRQDFWVPKLTANVVRDRRQRKLLRERGWKILVVWECDTTPTRRNYLKNKIAKFLTTKKPPPCSGG